MPGSRLQLVPLASPSGYDHQGLLEDLLMVPVQVAEEGQWNFVSIKELEQLFLVFLRSRENRIQAGKHLFEGFDRELMRQEDLLGRIIVLEQVFQPPPAPVVIPCLSEPMKMNRTSS